MQKPYMELKGISMSRLITQRAILTAFKEMLKDTPFNKITITDLSDRTGVNDLQDKPEGLDVSVFPTGSVSGLPVALHPYG